MEKLVYLIEKGSPSPDSSARRVLDCARNVAGRGCCRAICVNVRESDPAVRSLAAFYATSDGDRQLLASLSVWMDCLDARANIEEILLGLALPFHGYLVTESVPRDYSRITWELGDKSPGVTLVAAFRKPGRLSDAEFYRRWHEGHTKLSLEVHPLWRYVRNAVARPLTAAAPPFRAIVEERVRSVQDLSPGAFYQGQQQTVTDDLRGFVDFDVADQMRIELMSEYIILDF